MENQYLWAINKNKNHENFQTTQRLWILGSGYSINPHCNWSGRKKVYINMIHFFILRFVHYKFSICVRFWFVFQAAVNGFHFRGGITATVWDNDFIITVLRNCGYSLLRIHDTDNFFPLRVAVYLNILTVILLWFLFFFFLQPLGIFKSVFTPLPSSKNWKRIYILNWRKK